jgi:hypothetical protein
MATRTDLYNKYKKSDIFNLNPALNNSMAPAISSRNVQNYSLNTENNNHTIDVVKPINQKKYMLNYHQSDIFNVHDKSFQAQKKPKTSKIGVNPQISTCFDSMKDNSQFANDIKEYQSKYRGVKTEYEPDKYYHNENASERLYNQLYNKKRNPITTENNKTIENNEKDLFVERKKKMRNNFTKNFFDQRNIEDKIRLEQETERGTKNHKFYKSKGFTYMDNDNKSLNQNKFVTPDKYGNNSSKINKQIQLQSNVFPGEETKKDNNVDKIKERIDKAKEPEEDEPKNILNKMNKDKIKKNQEDKNLWGVVNSNWERSNLDWRNSDTEIIFRKTYAGRLTKMPAKQLDNRIDSPFQRKMDQLQDSNNKDTINESIKEKRKYVKQSYKDKTNRTVDLEKINEILDEIPENLLKYDKKKKIMFNANTTGLNGETGVNDNFVNYNKFHKNVLKKKEVKEPTIKIMSKNGEKRKNVDKNFNNVKKHDEYNIHDFVISYDSKPKNAKNSFDKFSENEVKLLFSKKGIHVYDIQKSQFDNGKYNVIKFKVRENEGENSLFEKMKDIENDFTKKDYKICIKKDIEKEKKKNLKHVTNLPGSKVAIFAENNDNKNNFKKKDPLQMKNNTKFTGQFNMIDHKYKK